jgi:hypothetical protein
MSVTKIVLGLVVLGGIGYGVWYVDPLAPRSVQADVIQVRCINDMNQHSTFSALGFSTKKMADRYAIASNETVRVIKDTKLERYYVVSDYSLKRCVNYSWNQTPIGEMKCPLPSTLQVRQLMKKGK